MQEADNLIISKERDAAMEKCEKLRLVAASIREEWSATLEVEDIEEAGNLLTEIEVADSKADKLQEVCNFDGDQRRKMKQEAADMPPKWRSRAYGQLQDKVWDPGGIFLHSFLKAHDQEIMNVFNRESLMQEHLDLGQQCDGVVTCCG